MASLLNAPIENAPIENPEEDDTFGTGTVDVETLISQKTDEIYRCEEECRRLRQELFDLKNICPRGGECSWESKWHGSHGRKECTKCGKEEYEYSNSGGRRRRKSKKRKTKRRRRRKKRKTKRRRKN